MAKHATFYYFPWYGEFAFPFVIAFVKFVKCAISNIKSSASADLQPYCFVGIGAFNKFCLPWVVDFVELSSNSSVPFSPWKKTPEPISLIPLRLQLLLPKEILLLSSKSRSFLRIWCLPSSLNWMRPPLNRPFSHNPHSNPQRGQIQKVNPYWLFQRSTPVFQNQCHL